MKHWKRVGAVALIAALFFAADWALGDLVTPPTHYQRLAARDRARYEGGLDTAFFGTSRVMRGVVPAVFDEALGLSSLNAATQMQSLKSSYYFLRDLEAGNPLKNVVLGLTFDDFSTDEIPSAISYMLVTDRMRSPVYKWELLSDSITLDQWPSVFSSLLRYGVGSFYANLRYKLKPSYIKAFFAADYPAMAYKNTFYEDKGHVRTERDFGGRDLPFQTDRVGDGDWRGSENLIYLRKIVEHCRERGLTLTVFGFPATRAVLTAYGDWYAPLDEHLRAYLAENGVAYYNLDRYEPAVAGLDDEYFCDARHLNQRGALLVSGWMAELMAGRGADFYEDIDSALRAMTGVYAATAQAEYAGGTLRVEVFANHPPQTAARYTYALKPRGAGDEAYETLLTTEDSSLELPSTQTGWQTLRVYCEDAAGSPYAAAATRDFYAGEDE